MRVCLCVCVRTRVLNRESRTVYRRSRIENQVSSIEDQGSGFDTEFIHFGFPYGSAMGLGHTVESPNKGHFGTVILSLVRRLSFLGSPKCIGTIRRKFYGTSSCVLCREGVLISERPLSEILLSPCKHVIVFNGQDKVGDCREYQWSISRHVSLKWRGVDCPSVSRFLLSIRYSS